ncbi:hypothetical protein [Methylobacterium sp. ID0610]|uniref:hypothetical protein n=1 Tax=Methylobacterium carpenticola TaxID=3344827 RepID=UPI0036AC8583
MRRPALTLALVLAAAVPAAQASPRSKRLAACEQAASHAERLQMGCWRLRHRPEPRRIGPVETPGAAARATHEVRASKEAQRQRDWLRGRAASMATDAVP